MFDQSPPCPEDLAALFGEIDVYLFDQLLKGRITKASRILDVGCGSGRNVEYLIRAGANVSVADPQASNVDAVRQFAVRAGAKLPAEQARVEAAESMSFDLESFDVVICCAVLHFANDEEHFDAMLGGVWRVLKPGGMFFARLASSIGLADRVSTFGQPPYQVASSGGLFSVDEAFLESRERQLGAVRLEPLKSVVVEQIRTMSVWCLSKPAL